MRILIADDHELVRQGVRTLLQARREWKVCGEAVNGRDAIEKAKELKPDVILMDISMPNLNGLEATREVRRILPKTEVLVLSQHNSPEMMKQAHNAGAQGYVVKSSASEDLVAALEKISRPETAPSAAKSRRRAAEVTARDAMSQNAIGNNGGQEGHSRGASIKQALRESEERFRGAMNNIAEGLYTLDAHGLVTYINPSAEALFGWTSAELLGKKIHDVVHYKFPDGTPFPASDCPGLQVLQKGIELREHQDTFIRKDGGFFPVVLSSSPLKIGDEITGVVVCFRDETKRRQAEESLRHSERIYRAIGESIDYGIWIADRYGRNIYASPSFLNLVGLTQQQCSELGWTHVLHPDDLDSTAAAWEECARTGTFWEREYRIRGADGNWHHVLGRGAPIRDSDGTILHWAGINLDIQQRKESEIALRRATTQFQLVSDTMATGVVRYSRDLRYLWANSRYAEFICRPLTEIVGHSMLEVLGEETCRNLRPHLDRVLAGHPVTFEQQIEYKQIGRRWTLAAYTPTFDSTGAADGWVACIVDITDQKQRDAELVTQAGLLDLSFNAVILRNAEDRITYWNKGAEELYGWTRQEVLGQDLHILLQTQFPEPLDLIRTYFNRDGQWQGELLHTCKDGRVLTVNSRWALTRDPDTNSELIMQANINITATKEAERQLQLLVQTLETRIAERTQELEHATDQLRELSGKLLRTQDEERRRIARELHDGVGQLLAAMNMNLSNLKNEVRGMGEDVARCLDENAALVEQASQEIRTISHLLHPPLLDVMGLESALRWYVDGYSGRSKITVEMNLPAGFSDGLPRDFSLSVFRIVQECLTNIHRHSESASAVIAVQRSSDQITLEIKDNGKGIPVEIQSKISSGESSGVGLRGIRERIRQFGGQLEVYSDHEGTRVVTVLPLPALEAVQKKNDSDVQSDNRAEPELRAATILCIDDEAAGQLPPRGLAGIGRLPRD